MIPTPPAGSRSSLWWRRAAIAAAIVGWALLPALASRSVVDVLVFTALYSIAGLGVAFLLGHCGIVSLAQSVFYGIGAYSSAYCSAKLGLPAPAGLAIGIAASIAIAWCVGWPMLRLSGYFLALATLALAIIGHVLFLEWEWLTGGTLGIGGVRKLELAGVALNTPQRYYYFVWPIVVGLIVLQRNLLRARNGFAMRALRDAPQAASALGIDTHAVKVKVFLLSAFVGSLAGSLFAHYVSFVSVDSFGVDRAISFLLLAVIGGARTVWGVVLGALFVVALPNALSRFGDAHALLFAVALVLAVMFVPQGFGGAVESAVRRLVGRVALSTTLPRVPGE